MKLWKLIGLLAISLLLAGFVQAQRTVRLTRPCNASTVRSLIEIERDGDISLVPCAGRSVLVNGSGLTGILNSLNGLTATAQTFATPTAADTAAWSSATATHMLQLPITAITGSTRTNYFPYFSAANTFNRSGLSWNGTSYRFDNNNTTPNANFTLNFTPQVSASEGLFNVGSASSAQIIANQSLAKISLITPTLLISATNFILNPTITPAGTTGAVTINTSQGTANVAAGAAALTVTSSITTASSLIFATAQTNDATCSVKAAVPANGSFIIRMTANCTAETSVAFWVTN